MTSLQSMNMNSMKSDDRLEHVIKLGRANLKATAPTDIWRKPPNLDLFNAPALLKAISIAAFKSVRVSASGE